MYHYGCLEHIEYPAFGNHALSEPELKEFANLKGFNVHPVPDYPMPSEVRWDTQVIIYNAGLSRFRLDFALAFEVGHICLNHKASYERLSSLPLDSLPENERNWFPGYTENAMRAEAVYFASYALFPGKKISALRSSKNEEQVTNQLLQEAKTTYPDSSDHAQIASLLNLRLTGNLLLKDLAIFAMSYAQ